MAGVSQVVVTCPKTGKQVSTGMAMDKKSFETAIMSGNFFLCPACGQTHTWDKKDAKLQG